MNEEEKKALKVINARTRRLLDELEIEKEDMSDELKIAYLMQEIRVNKTVLNLIEKLQKENEKLKKLHMQDNKHLDFIMENSITVQKVKDKIEELNQYYKKEIYPILYQWSDITITEHYDEMIGLLQELLEKSEEK